MPAPDTDRSRVLLRRVFSWTGVAPLGAFLLLHVAVAAQALWGTVSLVAAEDGLLRLPALGWLEVLFVFLPLAVHGGIGAGMVATRQTAASPSPYPAPVATAMRWTGIALLPFLVLHVVALRFRGAHAARLGGAAAASALASDLSTTWHGVPWQGALYLAGVACAVFHLCAGLWGRFATTARGRARPDLRRTWAWIAGVIAVALWALLTDVVVLHATGSALLAGTAPSLSEPCPAP